jgi:hypothetical protein
MTANVVASFNVSGWRQAPTATSTSSPRMAQQSFRCDQVQFHRHTPDAFTFTAQTGAALSSVATSNTLTVAGINSAANISVVGGTYSINGGGYTAVAGTVNNGDTVTVQQTASASYSTLTTATLTIGGVAGAFNVTTVAAPVVASPVHGVCGAANGVAASSAPSANRCATGPASAIAGSGPWTWSCYGSDGGSNASCSAPLALLNQTVGFGAAPSITVGGIGAVSATATSGLAVGFTSTTTVICTVSGSTVTGVAAGTCTIAANQAGNASYNPAPQATQSITIGKNSQTISFGAAPTVAVGVTGTVTATATSSLAVSFTSTTTGICTVSGSTVTGMAAGTCTIAANQVGNTSYNLHRKPTEAPSAEQQTISFGAAPSITVGGTGTASATATGLATSTSTTTGICTVSGSTVTGVAAGTCTIAANQAGSASYSAAPQVTQSITVTQAPVNGACGSANGIASAFAPNSNLCTAGTGSAVTAGSPWSWACNGSGGGTNANCSAPNQTTGGGSGSGGRAVVSGGTWVVDLAQSSGFVPTSGHAKSPPGLPPGTSFPYGLLDFVLNTGATGSAATIAITYPATLPAGAVYWKYGPSPAGYNCSGGACAAPHWYQMPVAQAVFAGDTVTLTIVDGGVGDDDLAANGTIVDQGGPSVPSVPGSSVAGIPTLSEWALLALAGLMGLAGMGAMRRRSVL